MIEEHNRTEFEKGFILGLIVGEGSFTGDGKNCTMEIKLHADDPEPLRYTQRILGGKIYGIYENNGRRFWHYILRGVELRANVRFFYKYLPDSKKRNQFLHWAGKYNLEFWEEKEVLKMKSK